MSYFGLECGDVCGDCERGDCSKVICITEFGELLMFLHVEELEFCMQAPQNVCVSPF